MPRVRPYESQVSPAGGLPASGVGNVETGTGAQALGQGIVSGGYAAAHAYQILQAFEDSRAVTDAHVAYAEIANRATQALDQAKKTADPADQDFFNKVYRGGAPEGEEPAEGSIQDQLNKMDAQITNPEAKIRSKQYASAITTSVLNDSVRFQSQLAGMYARQQGIKLVDQYQNMVQTDPSRHDEAINGMTAAIDDPKGEFYRVDAGVREQLKRDMTAQITSSTVRGYIAVAPQYALDQLQKGKWDNALTGEQKIVLTGAAETQIRGLEMDARRKEAELAKKKKDHSDSLDSMLAEQEILSHTGGSNTPPVGWKDILHASASGMDSDKVKSWMAKMEERTNRLNSGEVRTDIPTKLDLFKRIGLPFGNPRRMADTGPIDEAYLNKKLSDSDHDWLTRKFLDARSPDGDKLAADFNAFYKRVPEQPITKPGFQGIYADSSKGAWYDKYIQDVEDLKQSYIKAGKNPRDLINPNKPEYVGSEKFIAPYASPNFGKWPDLPVQPPAPFPPGAPPRKSLDQIFKGTP